jgi:hypothetical protein
MRLLGWFLISGSIGICVAIVLATTAAIHSINPAILFALWPSSIVGIVDPTDLADKIMVGTFEFGGNFLLYGFIGIAIGGLFFRPRN